jgi:hypothetical protein
MGTGHQASSFSMNYSPVNQKGETVRRLTHCSKEKTIFVIIALLASVHRVGRYHTRFTVFGYESRYYSKCLR